jgi:hypothetical protein
MLFIAKDKLLKVFNQLLNSIKVLIHGVPISHLNH